MWRDGLDTGRMHDTCVQWISSQWRGSVLACRVISILTIDIYNYNSHYLPDCDPQYRPQYNEFFSQQFFNDHICTCVNYYPPPDIVQFCSTVRPDKSLYHVMILTLTELCKDLKRGNIGMV